MTDELAGSVVESLSQYLTRKSKVGGSAYDAHMEDVLALLAAHLSSPFHSELLARFVDHPGSEVERAALNAHLTQLVSDDPEFGRQLAAALAGSIERRSNVPSRRRKPAVLAAVATIAIVIVTTFVIARSTAPSATPAPSERVTVTSIVELTPSAASPVTSTVSSQSSSVLPTESAPVSAVPGDGSALPKGTKVLLVDLPRPNDQWAFEHGDHDVRLTQHQDSVWNPLSTCNSDRYKGEQQFTLKNFSHVQVDAIGTDSTSDTSLPVKFSVFVNNDKVTPIASQVTNPGETKSLQADLPPGVFSIMLRTELTTVDRSTCRSANAVWGTPYAIASGQ